MQEQKEIKESQISRPWKVFTFEAFLVSFTFTLGILSAFRVKKLLKIEKAEIPPVSFWQFLYLFLLATLVILFVSFFGKKFQKGKQALFRVIFIFAITSGGLFFFSLWMPDLFALVLVVILVFSWLKKATVLIHNLVMILGMVGIGSVLGLSLTPEIIIALLIIFSIYDFIAVYKTKHMIKMAKEMIESGAILGFILPEKISDLKAGLKEVKPGGRFLILGGGDIAFPLIFCVSLTQAGILNSLIVAIFALLGLLFSFWIFINQPLTSPNGKRQPIPALPAIALFSIIGYLITKLI